jgi:hypothetical protein
MAARVIDHARRSRSTFGRPVRIAFTSMFRTIFVIFLLIVFLAPLSFAAPRDQAAIDRDAQRAQEERDTAARFRDLEGALANDTFRYGAFVKADLVESKKAAEALAVIHEKIAAALVAGDEAELKRLRKAEAAAARLRDLWHDRIGEWRKRQAEAAPDENWFQEQIRWQRGWLAELLEYVQARKAASEAWGKVADSVTPDADPGKLIALKDEAYALDAEREIAELKFNWAYQRELVWNDKKLNTEALRKSLAALQKAQEARVAFRREEIERSRRARELDRAISQADKEFRKAFETAQKEAIEARNQRAKK